MDRCCQPKLDHIQKQIAAWCLARMSRVWLSSDCSVFICLSHAQPMNDTHTRATQNVGCCVILLYSSGARSVTFLSQQLIVDGSIPHDSPISARSGGPVLAQYRPLYTCRGYAPRQNIWIAMASCMFHASEEKPLVKAWGKQEPAQHHFPQHDLTHPLCLGSV